MNRFFRRSLRAAAVIFVALSCGSAIADFSFTHGDHSYLVVEQGRTWQAAAADAVSRQTAGVAGHLAIIESAAENTAIFNQLIANISPREFPNTQAPDGGNGYFVWIAANDLAVEGNWIWDGDNDGAGQLFYQGRGNAGGMPVGGLYHNWGTFNGNPHEPDNGAGGLQDAGGIALANYPRGLAGQWNDVRADNSLYYIVEFDAVPEPTTIALVTVGAVLGGITSHRRRSNLLRYFPSSIDFATASRCCRAWCSRTANMPRHTAITEKAISIHLNE
jgi:hypothetical protein